ncbi:MAG: hypothetical protein KBH07_00500 [Flavobacteriales bacterium]|nr:hypothetical protein [Flavobacteriales bacterium]MBP9079480.1 hypothetical protein [Flavobacteriales bacterium]
MPRSPHLVPLLPEPFSALACPACGSSKVEVRGSVWPGIHVLGVYACRACGLDFLRDLPVGFAVDHPMAIGIRDGKLYNPSNGPGWIHVPLMNGHADQRPEEVGIERVVHRHCERIVVLNALDFLYGHVLLKLYNAQYYLDHHPGLGLVVVVPRMFLWLVPEGVAEVWLVDQRLGDARNWHTGIDRFVQAQLPRYKEVYLGKGYAHPEFAGMDIERFSKVAPFPLDQFLERPPHITFVLREDRLWIGGPVLKLLYRVARKLGRKGPLLRWFIHAQDRLVRRSIKRIRRLVPQARFAVVGLGRPGGMPPDVVDLRTLKMDTQTELAWCRQYASSQVVVGVHGSNMLLPTAHSAGCVEILPYDRYGNMVQDISVRYHNRMQLFLYRFIDEFATPRCVARHVVSIFTDFKVYNQDNQVNIFQAE